MKTPVQDTMEEGRAALRHAHKAASRGDLAAAERWSKTAERLAASAARLAAIAPPVAEDDPERLEDLRAELRRRLARFVEAHHANEAWDPQNGPQPYSDDDLDAIARGKDV